MGFAWHKLFPRPTEFISATGSTCVPPPPCEGEIYTSTVCIGICINTNNNGICLGYLETCYDITGQSCNDPVVETESVSFNVRENPGCPQEYEFDNLEHRCTLANVPSVNEEFLSNYPDSYWGVNRPYYYRSPSTPTSTPSTVRITPLCLTYETMTIPDRIQIISGRNRYRYTGYLSGIYPPIEGGTPISMRNLVLGSQNLYADQTTQGIIGYEQSLGRSFPLADSYMQLPLFGASESVNPTDPCFDFCYSVECVTCRTNSGVGHYSGRFPNGPGNAEVPD